MSYILEYIYTFFRCLGVFGIVYVVGFAYDGETVALYCCLFSLIVAVAGPIGLYINKKEKQ